MSRSHHENGVHICTSCGFRNYVDSDETRDLMFHHDIEEADDDAYEGVSSILASNGLYSVLMEIHNSLLERSRAAPNEPVWRKSAKQVDNLIKWIQMFGPDSGVMHGKGKTDQ